MPAGGSPLETLTESQPDNQMRSWRQDDLLGLEPVFLDRDTRYGEEQSPKAQGGLRLALEREAGREVGPCMVLTPEGLFYNIKCSTDGWQEVECY